MNDGKTERKVIQGGLWGGVTIILIWIMGMFGLEVPSEVAQAFTIVISQSAAWWTS